MQDKKNMQITVKNTHYSTRLNLVYDDGAPIFVEIDA